MGKVINMQEYRDKTLIDALIYEAAHNGIVLERADFKYFNGYGPFIDGMDAENWLEAMLMQ